MKFIRRKIFQQYLRDRVEGNVKFRNREYLQMVKEEDKQCEDGFTILFNQKHCEFWRTIPGRNNMFIVRSIIFIGTKPAILEFVFHNPFIYQRFPFMEPGNSIHRLHRKLITSFRFGSTIFAFHFHCIMFGFLFGYASVKRQRKTKPR